MTERRFRGIYEWMNHPWALLLAGSLFGAIASELTPLKLITKYAGPAVFEAYHLLAQAITVPAWSLPAIAVASVFAWRLALTAWWRTRSRRRTIVDGVTFQVGRQTAVRAWPVCRVCNIELLARAEPEERLDRNNLPFVYRPEHSNVLFCASCGIKTHLDKPLVDMASDALAKAGHVVSMRKPDVIQVRSRETGE